METPDLSCVVWRKSSRSQPTQSDCVEVARLHNAVAVRDSRDPRGPVHILPVSSFRGLVARIKDGDLGL